jgi:hypothetical protein
MVGYESGASNQVPSHRPFSKETLWSATHIINRAD